MIMFKSQPVFRILLIGLAFLCAAALRADASPQFSRIIEDLPLPEAFQESGSPAVFDSSEGRLITTSGLCLCPLMAIAEFYALTLPALGWHAMPDGGSYTRAGERLTIEFVPAPTGKRGETDQQRVLFRLIAPRASTRLEE